MPLMGAPIFLAILGVVALLFWVFTALDGDYGSIMGVSVDRGFGLWIGLATGLTVVALLLLVRWLRRERLGLVSFA